MVIIAVSHYCNNNQNNYVIVNLPNFTLQAKFAYLWYAIQRTLKKRNNLVKLYFKIFFCVKMSISVKAFIEYFAEMQLVFVCKCSVFGYCVHIVEIRFRTLNLHF